MIRYLLIAILYLIAGCNVNHKSDKKKKTSKSDISVLQNNKPGKTVISPQNNKKTNKKFTKQKSKKQKNDKPIKLTEVDKKRLKSYKVPIWVNMFVYLYEPHLLYDFMDDKYADEVLKTLYCAYRYEIKNAYLVWLELLTIHSQALIDKQKKLVNGKINNKKIRIYKKRNINDINSEIVEYILRQDVAREDILEKFYISSDNPKNKDLEIIKILDKQCILEKAIYYKYPTSAEEFVNYLLCLEFTKEIASKLYISKRQNLYKFTKYFLKIKDFILYYCEMNYPDYRYKSYGSIKLPCLRLKYVLYKIRTDKRFYSGLNPCGSFMDTGCYAQNEICDTEECTRWFNEGCDCKYMLLKPYPPVRKTLGFPYNPSVITPDTITIEPVQNHYVEYDTLYLYGKAVQCKVPEEDPSRKLKRLFNKHFHWKRFWLSKIELTWD